ncbi:MAG: hypothetical protein HXK84_00560 [Lachnospiraceae bacterium]|nr:hypothetical protein [Lachnospiraceae bacterium]
MKTRGMITGIQVPFRSHHPVISFQVDADPEQIEKYNGVDLDISFTKHRKHRSLNANALLWSCLQEIAIALHADAWSVYLHVLERYGKFTYILVKPEAVSAVRELWRETKIIGDIEIDGKPMKEMLCFFGSSVYNSKEFSHLLNGVIEDMKEMHLDAPASEEVQEIIKEIEKREQIKEGQTANEKKVTV